VLRFGPLAVNTVHICVDMQRLFAEPTEWQTPWMERVLPQVVRLVEPRPERTIFTRFIPAAEPGDGIGRWRHYYKRWASMTRVHLVNGMTELVEPLARFVPPAHLVDKPVYSPWLATSLHSDLQRAGIDTLVVSGGETEVCVGATVLGAIDFGYRVILASDALCSSADATHDAMMKIYSNRFGMQVETATTDEINEDWNPQADLIGTILTAAR
jgi:nicotinamidase-related amidase